MTNGVSDAFLRAIPRDIVRSYTRFFFLPMSDNLTTAVGRVYILDFHIVGAETRPATHFFTYSNMTVFAFFFLFLFNPLSRRNAAG